MQSQLRYKRHCSLNLSDHIKIVFVYGTKVIVLSSISLLIGFFVQLLTIPIASILMWIQLNKIKYIRLSPFYEISMITISFARCKVASYAPCSKVLMRSNSNGSNHNAMKYESLHLAGRVILMHYVSFITNKNSCIVFLMIVYWNGRSVY